MALAGMIQMEELVEDVWAEWCQLTRLQPWLEREKKQ
jgi:hypothetical protein